MMHQQAVNGKAQASFGLFGGSIQVTSQQLDAMGSAMCKSGLSDIQSSSNLDVYRQFISETGVNAFEQCLKLNNAGLFTTTEFDEDNQDSIVVQVHYSAPPGVSAQQRVDQINIDQPNDTEPNLKVTCDGPLAIAARQNIILGSRVLAMTCRRPIIADRNNAILFKTNRVLASPVRISILTSAGAITRELEPVRIGAPPIPDLPIGSVLAFFLSPDEIKKLAPKWIPADGTNVNIPGSACKGQQLPDLRDKFVLGASPTQNVKSQDAANIGGTYNNTFPLAINNAMTEVVATEDIRDRETGRFAKMPGAPPRYLHDTITDELDASNHVHRFSVRQDFPVTIQPPPFRRLVYLVHCSQ